MDAEGVTPARILLADDQLSVLKASRPLLKGAGYEIETAAPRAAFAPDLSVVHVFPLPQAQALAIMETQH